MTAKLSCELLTTRTVLEREADWATPRARINDGSAIVHSVQISDAVNSRSISVNPDSPFGGGDFVNRHGPPATFFGSSAIFRQPKNG